MAKKTEILKEISNYPSLEELLWAMNGMKKCKVFTKLKKFDEEGYIVQAFTKKGGELYERLVSLIHGVFALTVETLDNIVRNET